MPNFAKIAQTAAEIWWFFDFQRWQPSAILHLLCLCLDHLRMAFGGLYRCAKFGWNWCSSFDNMHDFRFRLFTPRKLGLWGIWAHNWGAISTRPQKAHPWAERRHMTYRSWKWVHRCDLCASRRGQKETMKETRCTVEIWVFAETTHVVGSKWNFAWWVASMG